MASGESNGELKSTFILPRPRSKVAATLNSPSGLLQVVNVASFSLELMDPDDFIKHSTVEVKHATVYKKNLPATDGPLDLRKGTINRSLQCQTCNRGVNCNGHTGFHRLHEPGVNPIGRPKIYMNAKAICHACSRCLIPKGSRHDERILAVPDEQKLSVAAKLGRTYSYCGYSPDYRDDVWKFFKTAKDDSDEVVESKRVAFIEEFGCGAKQRFYPNVKDRLRFHCWYDPTDDLLIDESNEAMYDNDDGEEKAAAAANERKDRSETLQKRIEQTQRDADNRLRRVQKQSQRDRNRPEEKRQLQKGQIKKRSSKSRRKKQKRKHGKDTEVDDDSDDSDDRDASDADSLADGGDTDIEAGDDGDDPEDTLNESEDAHLDMNEEQDYDDDDPDIVDELEYRTIEELEQANQSIPVDDQPEESDDDDAEEDEDEDVDCDEQEQGDDEMDDAEECAETDPTSTTNITRVTYPQMLASIRRRYNKKVMSLMPPRDDTLMDTPVPSFSNKSMYKIITNQSAATVARLGMKSHPKHFFWLILPIPENGLLAATAFEGSLFRAPGESSFLRQINEIIRINVAIGKQKPLIRAQIARAAQAKVQTLAKEQGRREEKHRKASIFASPGRGPVFSTDGLQHSFDEYHYDDPDDTVMNNIDVAATTSAADAELIHKPTTIRQQQEDAREIEAITHMLEMRPPENPIDDPIDYGAYNDPVMSLLLSRFQFEISALVQNEFPVGSIPSSHQSKAKTRVSVREKLVGKEGWSRDKQQGKRPEQTARGVITPSIWIGIGEASFPEAMCRELSKEELVTRDSYQRLLKLVRSTEYPRAECLRAEEDGVWFIKDLTNVDRSTQELRLGWSVVRNLMEGDPQLLNRQPSLTTGNILGVRARVHPDSQGSSIYTNEAASASFAFDYDGDEETVQNVQSQGANREVGHLMTTSQHQTTPQSGAPIIGIFLNAALGLNRLTQQEFLLDAHGFLNLVSVAKFWDGSSLPAAKYYEEEEEVDGRGAHIVPTWTGKQVMSAMCPPITYCPEKSNRNTSMPLSIKDILFVRSTESSGYQVSTQTLNAYTKSLLNDELVIMVRGQLLVGTADKSMWANSPESLNHISLHQFGPAVSIRLKEDLQKIGVVVLDQCGYTLKWEDMTFDHADEVQERTDKLLRYVDGMPDLDPTSALVSSSSTITAATQNLKLMQEATTARLLNDIRENAGGLIAANHANLRNPRINQVQMTIDAGVKASQTHITQIMGVFGQTYTRGERMRIRFNGRTLCYFPAGDQSTQAMGFIAANFYKGFNIKQMWHSARDGREGLVDQAMFIGPKGYTFRQIKVAMESVSTMNDHMVCDAAGNILAFSYDQDNANPYWLIRNELALLKMTEADVAAYCQLDDHRGNGELQQEFQRLNEARVVLQSRSLCWANDKERDSVMLSVHLPSVLLDWQAKNHAESIRRGHVATGSDALTEVECIRLVDVWLQYVQMEYESRNGFSIGYVEFQAAVRFYCCSSKIVNTYCFTKNNLSLMLIDIERKFRNHLADPAFPVGMLGSQGVTEASTQGVISSFHNSGRHVATQLEREKEIEDVIHNSDQKTETMVIYLRPEAEAAIQDHCDSLNPLSFANVIQTCAVSRVSMVDLMATDDAVEETNQDEEQDGADDCIDLLTSRSHSDVETRSIIRSFFSLMDGRKHQQCYDYWLRFQLDTAAMARHRISFATIVDCCEQRFSVKNGCYWVFDSRHLVERTSAQNEPRFLYLFFKRGANVLKSMLAKKDSQLSAKAAVQNSHISTLTTKSNGVYQDVIEAMNQLGVFLTTSVSLRGVPKIHQALVSSRQVQIRADPNHTGSAILQRTRPVIVTRGSNLRHIFNLRWVDPVLTSCSSVKEVVGVLGIDAGYEAICKSIQKCMESQPNTKVLERHHKLIARYMTHRGYVVGIQRHDLNKLGDVGLLLSMSFEEMMKRMVTGALYNHTDPCHGVTEAIQTGNPLPLGTGVFRPKLDAPTLVPTEDTRRINESLHQTERHYCAPFTKAELFTAFHQVHLDPIPSSTEQNIIEAQVASAQLLLRTNNRPSRKRKHEAQQQQANHFALQQLRKRFAEFYECKRCCTTPETDDAFACVLLPSWTPDVQEQRDAAIAVRWKETQDLAARERKEEAEVARRRLSEAEAARELSLATKQVATKQPKAKRQKVLPRIKLPSLTTTEACSALPTEQFIHEQVDDYEMKRRVHNWYLEGRLEKSSTAHAPPLEKKRGRICTAAATASGVSKEETETKRRRQVIAEIPLVTKDEPARTSDPPATPTLLQRIQHLLRRRH